MLNQKRIAELAARKGVKSIAVENFLGSMCGMSRGDALANLRMDARSYKWNAATIKAIEKGIMESVG